VSLWLCLRFAQLPLQCLNRSEQQPVAVISKQRVLRANDHAVSLGIRQGMSAATVRALADQESLLLLERAPDTEQRCLQQLCCWAYSITPNLHSYRDDCLQLEIGGCLSLFKGLDALLSHVDSGIRHRGYRVETALADTPKAAWLLSYADPAAAMDIHTATRTRLTPLPLTLLDDFSSTVDSLRRAGLHTLGDILTLPTAALGRRCGKTFTTFLQQLLGERKDLQGDYRPPETFSDEYWFGYEVKANAELLPAIQLLLKSLCQFLRNTQLQTSEIQWQLVGIDSGLQTMTVRSSSSHSNRDNWYQLTCIRIEQLQLDGSIEGLALQCNALRAGELDSLDLFSPHNQREPMGSLPDRLRSRLGLQAIKQVGSRDEHLPELALYISSEAPQGDYHTPPLEAQRPFWLMEEPRQLKQHGDYLYWNGRLKLIYGPERIEDNWWQEAASRDYFIAENNHGQHYWVFNNRLTRCWFVHGVFA
jgi:protein ImuB